MHIFFLFIILCCSVIFLKSLHETKNKHNVFGLTRFLLPFGIFVWGDGVVLSIFWIIVSVASLVLNSWSFFLLCVSVFWVVRSLGEIIYWLNQQFSTINRNPPETLLGYSIFHNDSIWFIYQLAWQCVMVLSMMCSIFFAVRWVGSL